MGTLGVLGWRNRGWGYQGVILGYQGHGGWGHWDPTGTDKATEAAEG